MQMNKQQKINLFPYILVFFEIAIYLSNDMYLPSMPAIAQELSFSQAQIQNTLTLWFLGASCLQFILGPISDTYGRRVVLITGGIFYVISSAACALADTLHVLLTARFIQGLTLCALVAGYASIQELYSTKQAIKILALMNAVTILAPAFGPLIGALIVQFTSWRDIFWLLAGMGFIGTLLLIVFMPESNNNRHELHPGKIARGYIKIFSNPDFMYPSIGYCLLLAIFFVWMFEAPFLMIEVHKTSNLYYGISQACIFGCFFVGAAATKQVLNRYNIAILVKISTLIAIFGVGLFALTAFIYNDILLSIISMMIISIGASMLFGPINRIAIEASTQPMGRRTAVFSMLIGLFGALTGWMLSIFPLDNLLDLSIFIIFCMLLATLAFLLTKVPLATED